MKKAPRSLVKQAPEALGARQQSEIEHWWPTIKAAYITRIELCPITCSKIEKTSHLRECLRTWHIATLHPESLAAPKPIADVVVNSVHSLRYAPSVQMHSARVCARAPDDHPFYRYT